MTERTVSRMVRVSIGGAVFGVLLGSLLHFTYQASGQLTLVALFSPVNESPWEHLKLYFIPIVLYIAVEWFFVADKPALLFAKLVQIIAGMLFIEAFFYTYTGALGIENVWLDILSFVVAMASGYALSHRLVRNRVTCRFPAWLSATAIALIALIFISMTFAPLHLPVFRDSRTGTYGVT